MKKLPFNKALRIMLYTNAMVLMATAMLSPIFDSIYSKHIDRNKSGIQWGAWESMSYFAIAIGVLAGGALVTLFGFQILFVSMAVLCFGSSLYIYNPKRNIL